MDDLRNSCLLNPNDYPGMCYSCKHYDDYGPVAGRFNDFNGRCKVDKHETDALVKCKINSYDIMNVKEYEDFMSTSKVYDCLPIIYPILGMNGEAGEAAEKVKKCLRDNGGVFGGIIKKDLMKELADVLWYIWAAADDMGFTLEDVMKTGIEKVKARQKTNTVHGAGDNREIINK